MALHDTQVLFEGPETSHRSTPGACSFFRSPCRKGKYILGPIIKVRFESQRVPG